MGLLDVLLGRTRLGKSKRSGLFSMVTAEVTLATQHQLTPLGKAGLCFKPVSSSFFDTLEQEVRGLLRVGEKTAGTQFRVTDDSYGFRWVILGDRDFEDLVTGVHLVSDAFVHHGFEGQLLATVFPFRSGGQDVHWIYSYKRGRFYPFVPRGASQERDNARELSLASKMERELPIEREMEFWYALWGIPFDAL